MSIKKTKGLTPLSIERLYQSVRHVIRQNNALKMSVTKEIDTKRCHAVFDYFGLRDYLLIAKSEGFQVFPLRTGLYCNVENADNAYFIASNGEVCEVEPVMANKLLSNPPLLNKKMTTSAIVREVKKTLELEAWRGWHCKQSHATDNLEGWNKWIKYFERVKNPIMAKYITTAINFVEQNEIKAQQEKMQQQM